MAGERLEIDEIVVSYGGDGPVLDGLSLDVAPAEFVALLGSSGCGKTTLLRAISGFVPVSRGSIRVGGREIGGLPPEKRDMAMVFQSYALWPHMTVAQNIGYGLRLRHWPRPSIARRIDEVLAMLGLAGFGGRRVTQLSGGQRQRVALGRALAVDPHILLLDEPLSNLDARIREEVRHEIKALQQRLGITAIHVTHDREEAMVMADRLVIMDRGRIAQLGAPEEVYRHPASPFVASFMGASNVVELIARPRDGGIVIEAGPNNAGFAIPDADRRLAADGGLVAHFRSEAARLVLGDEVPADALVLHGHIRQGAYPGGSYRYAVTVGDRQFLVDDERRLEVGAKVGICLAADAIHLYPRSQG
jgi:ABC-type Fe3+/spermidine/putrescine transport system ATPase subunit